jgi:PBSX family phage terminase large subunit
MTPFSAYGANRRIVRARDLELLAEGPAGTGKTITTLHKLGIAAEKYPGMRAAIVRKTRTSMTQTVLQTMESKVLPGGMKLHTTRQSYTFPNGSEIVAGGMDKPDKILSSEYDMIFVNEGTELTLVDYETLLTRLRHNVMPYQQIIVDCNPGPKTHWLNERAQAGQMMRIKTTHKDNPMLWDGRQWTDAGRRYLEILRTSLSGLRYKRYYEGEWATAEGVIYEAFDPDIHIHEPFVIPADWPRFRSIDFGYSNAFVCQWWAMDPDGRLYRYKLIYMTKRTVRQHAEQINALSAGESYVATVADHDAEDRATLLENGIPTVAANKAVSLGIERVQQRLKVQGDGRPRIYFFGDGLVELDHTLKAIGKPTSDIDEFGTYTWKQTAGNVKDEPVKIDDHGMDAMRYMVMRVDRGWSDSPPPPLFLSGATRVRTKR